MKICVYAISKNESQFVRRFCDSARDADMIFVADTGSTDDTVQLLEECGATVAHISIKPWRFDDARNAALAMVPDEFDVCVSLDLDEVMQPGWREEVERLWTAQTTHLRYGYEWGRGIVFQYEKIHARHGFRWASPCHEVIVCDRSQDVWAETDKVLVVHMADQSKSRGQYLDILRVSVTENPLDARHAFYYGRELKFNGQWDAAIAECKRYLALPTATWDHERGYACRVIGESYQALGLWDEAIRWHRTAVTEAPRARESWCALALCAYRMSRWAECFGAALSCLGITDKERVYTMDPAVWGAQPHDLAAIAAWNLGLHTVALEHARTALLHDPNEFRLRENVKFMQEYLNPPLPETPTQRAEGDVWILDDEEAA